MVHFVQYKQMHDTDETGEREIERDIDKERKKETNSNDSGLCNMCVCMCASAIKRDCESISGSEIISTSETKEPSISNSIISGKFILLWMNE